MESREWPVQMVEMGGLTKILVVLVVLIVCATGAIVWALHAQRVEWHEKFEREAAGHRAEKMMAWYRETHARNELFIDDDGRLLWKVGEFQLMYYSFTWSGSRTSVHGAHQLLFFDRGDEYRGRIVLHTAVARLEADGATATITLDDGARLRVDCAAPEPRLVEGFGLYVPR